MRKRHKHANYTHRSVSPTTEKTETAPPVPTKAQISALMAYLGRKGGKVGGKRRLETLSSEQRTQIAKKAATARWRNR